jgi:CheY-like chemotaxis protein
MRLNILLAEDNLGDVLLVQQALDEFHVEAELHVVRDGAEAIDFLSRMGSPGYAPCPNVMLLDLNLPKVDGPEVLREFRRRPDCAHTPVVVISSSDSPKDRARTAELGISRYFKKPSELGAFLQLGAVVMEVVRENCSA